MYEFSQTGELLPILIGTMMSDPAGSGQEVPILGAGHSKKTGRVVPLGGTMEDPYGGGKSPALGTWSCLHLAGNKLDHLGDLIRKHVFVEFCPEDHGHFFF